ncbi:MAG: amino acid adenylation domain-containing protein [Herpetosiphonaceae bacterium]|nr:amino acid adenylation domain-containing protein [Herpetosiphonaceae bacterium]
MSELSQRIANLSPEKRAVLEQALVKRASVSAKSTGIGHRASLGPAPLSFGQQRLWFLDQLDPDSHLYTIASCWQMNGQLDVDALRRAFNMIVARHEVLRTTFQSVEGIPVQVVAPSRTVELPIVDLSMLAADECEAEVKRILNEASRHHFHLTYEPSLDVQVLRLEAEQHILVSTWHHIASDAWSAATYERELFALYAAYVAGKPSPLPELPIQYADFAVWQRERLQGPLLEAQLAYWREQLADSPLALALPTDRPRPRLQSYEGAEQVVHLPQDLSEALNHFSRREGVTLFMVLLAALKVLLLRSSGQTDLVVGTPIAGRQVAETEGLIGLFLNTLVLRTHLDGNPTFRELLARVRTTALGAYAHQDVPFEGLVEELRVERDVSRTPLFQVMFNLRSPPRPPLELAGLALKRIELESKVAQYDLNLAVIEQTDGLRLQLEYSVDLFDRVTVVRMLEHFQSLLRAIVADPQQRIEALPLLSEPECRQLLVEWNDTACTYAQQTTIQRAFEEQVARTPDAVAVVYENSHLCYGELNQRANQLAHYLQRMGVGPDVPVGVCVERSPEMVVGLLAILKAGGAYLPLDPTYPPERLAFMLADAQPTVLLAQQSLVKQLPPHEATVVCLDGDWSALAQERDANLNSGGDGEQLAYIIYTSGSTGQPKGVLGTHRGALNRFNWMWQRYPFAADDVYCQKTAFSFVDSIWEIFGPLLQGTRIIIIPDRVVKDPQELLRVLADHNVTRIVLVPSLLRMLLETKVDLGQQLPRLKYWFSSGEALPWDLAQRLLASMPHGVLLNLYGSSEVAADVTYYEVSREQRGGRVPVGRPIANTQIYLLDRQMQPVPIGVTGEVHVGGAGVARGYLKRAELSAAKFVPDPFSDEPGARLYKTGDLARYLPDGMIEYVGRNDDQIKIRGFRVELGEIEASLAQHPGVRQAVVVAGEFRMSDVRLVAYVIAREIPGPSVHELRAFLHSHLPAYMVPADFMVVDALPLTSSGKVDRRALPAASTVQPTVDATSAAPQDALELQLTLLWEQFLGRRPIGREDNFFEIGGHSLLAVRLFAQIEERLGRRLPLAMLFEAPTIAGLAHLLRQDGWSPTRSLLVAIQPGGTKPPLFCVTPAGMTALYFVDLARHLGPDQPLYGFQAVGLEHDEPPHTCIEQMAAHYIAQMRRLQPTGPYLLGGNCLGGDIAFEMSRQLEQSGQEVALLALMDAEPPLAAHIIEVLKRVHYIYQVGLLPVVVKRMVKAMVSRGRLRPRLRQFEDVGANDSARLQSRRIRSVFDATIMAFRHYRGRPYGGRITLLYSSQAYQFYGLFWTRWWEQWAGAGVECYVIPAKHLTMLREPSAQRVAAQLTACLDAVTVRS